MNPVAWALRGPMTAPMRIAAPFGGAILVMPRRGDAFRPTHEPPVPVSAGAGGMSPGRGEEAIVDRLGPWFPRVESPGRFPTFPPRA
jgi:hypothetical protein